MRVLIIEDGTQRGTLSAVRSLGRSGATVEVASPTKGFAAHSRFCSRWHRVPPVHEAISFRRAVKKAAEEGGYDILFGGGDEELLALSRMRDDLPSSIAFPHPPAEAVTRALDKAELSKAATRAGLSVPRNEEDGGNFPFVIKERVHGSRRRDPANYLIPHFAANAGELAAVKEAFRAAGVQPFVQEAVQGDLMALVVLTDQRGETIAAGQQIALATWPPSAGASTRSFTVPVDRDLLGSARRLLQDLRWTGLAELQFMLAPGDPPRFIDFNGRFYGSQALAGAAGLDLPVRWADQILGRADAGPIEAIPGVRYQWLAGDLRRAFQERRGGLIRDLWACFSWAATSSHSVSSRDDPAPGIKLAIGLSAGALKKARSWT